MPSVGGEVKLYASRGPGARGTDELGGFDDWIAVEDIIAGSLVDR